MNAPKAEDLPKVEIPNLQIRYVAQQFRDAVKCLVQHAPNSPNDETATNAPHVVMMLASFAIELYLKSMNAKTEYIPIDLGDGKDAKVSAHLLTADAKVKREKG